MPVSRRRQRHVAWFGLLAVLGNLLVAPIAHAAMLRADAAPWVGDLCTAVKAADTTDPAGKSAGFPTNDHTGHEPCPFCGSAVPLLPPLASYKSAPPRAATVVYFAGDGHFAPVTLRYFSAARPQGPPALL